MKENFKIEKELLFKNNIRDVSSISLDREFKLDEICISGNFLISGEYKAHELSLNKEKFNFKIPFSYEVSDDIDKDSVNVEIIDFIYDYRDDELIVNIEYEISGDRKDILEFNDDESLDKFLETREVEVIDTRVDEINKLLESVEEENLEDDSIEEINNIHNTSEVDTEEIFNSIDNISDKYITYKIYKVCENDTLESIVLKYHTSIDELKELNDLTNISIGDKLIIPNYE